MGIVQTAQQEKINYSERLTLEKIKELNTSAIKQYLYGKTIKMNSMDYNMLIELKNRGEDITKYKID